jgi:hypothetical protein
MKYYNKELAKLPKELQSIVTSLDISNISRNIGIKIRLGHKETIQLEESIRNFLITVWTVPHINTMEILPMGLNGNQREVFYMEFYNKILFPITNQLEKAGLTNYKALFENRSDISGKLTIVSKVERFTAFSNHLSKWSLKRNNRKKVLQLMSIL